MPLETLVPILPVYSNFPISPSGSYISPTKQSLKYWSMWDSEHERDVVFGSRCIDIKNRGWVANPDITIISQIYCIHTNALIPIKLHFLTESITPCKTIPSILRPRARLLPPYLYSDSSSAESQIMGGGSSISSSSRLSGNIWLLVGNCDDRSEF